MIDVNLLPSATVLSQTEKKLRGRLKIIMIISGSATVFLLAVFLVTNAVLGLQLAQQKQKQRDLVSQFQVQMQTALDLRKLKDKISGIKTVQSGQTDFQSMAASASAVLTDGITLKSISLDKDGGIDLTATAVNLDALQTFIPAISNEAKSPFKKITMSGLRLGKDNSFSFALNMTYGLKKN